MAEFHEYYVGSALLDVQLLGLLWKGIVLLFLLSVKMVHILVPTTETEVIEIYREKFGDKVVMLSTSNLWTLLDQAILRRTLKPTCTILPLMKKEHKNNLEFFLTQIGKIHLTG